LDIFREAIAARARLMINHPFLGIVATNLRVIVAQANPGILASVDAQGRLYVGPEFLEGTETGNRSLTKKLRETIIAHETLHIILEHILRGKNYEDDLWGLAIDYIVNDILIESRFPKIEGMYYDTNISRDSNGKMLSAEQVHIKLLSMEKVEYKKLDEHLYSNDSAEPGLTKEEILSIVSVASTVAGSLPGSLKEVVGELLSPKVDWRRLLQQFIVNTEEEDINWRNRNITLNHIGYFPSYEDMSMEDIVFAIDTSGSISSEQLRQAVSEIYTVLSRFDIQSIYIIQHDYVVQSCQKYTPRDLPEVRNLTISGRGGTNFIPVFDYIRDYHIHPRVLIMLTDSYGAMPDIAPSYPVVWIMNNEFGWAPFGKIICL
jgi:predicted metal-dependent peptidase